MSHFEEWLPKVVADPIVVAHEINTEAHANCWSFGPPEDETETLENAAVKAFLLHVIEARSQALREQADDKHPMFFYIWYDLRPCTNCSITTSMSSLGKGSSPKGR